MRSRCSTSSLMRSSCSPSPSKPTRRTSTYTVSRSASSALNRAASVLSAGRGVESSSASPGSAGSTLALSDHFVRSSSPESSRNGSFRASGSPSGSTGSGGRAATPSSAATRPWSSMPRRATPLARSAEKWINQKWINRRNGREGFLHTVCRALLTAVFLHNRREPSSQASKATLYRDKFYIDAEMTAAQHLTARHPSALGTRPRRIRRPPQAVSPGCGCRRG